MSEQIMTPKQLQELADDIRDGISMIVSKEDYYDMEAENKRLREAIIVALTCGNGTKLCGACLRGLKRSLNDTR